MHATPFKDAWFLQLKNKIEFNYYPYRYIILLSMELS